jgi:hypothetical protein
LTEVEGNIDYVNPRDKILPDAKWMATFSSQEVRVVDNHSPMRAKFAVGK